MCQRALVRKDPCNFFFFFLSSSSHETLIIEKNRLETCLNALSSLCCFDDKISFLLFALESFSMFFFLLVVKGIEQRELALKQSFKKRFFFWHLNYFISFSSFSFSFSRALFTAFPLALKTSFSLPTVWYAGMVSLYRTSPGSCENYFECWNTRVRQLNSIQFTEVSNEEKLKLPMNLSRSSTQLYGLMMMFFGSNFHSARVHCYFSLFVLLFTSFFFIRVLALLLWFS